ncbi:MAG: PQQ-binding-like beta-propeller repeat protein [Alphaproteobacteria bacterium]
MRIGGLVAVAALAVAMLAGCELPSWLGEREDPPLPGERISVLTLDKTLEPDPRIADLEVRLPPPWRNPAWPQPGGVASNAMHHLELGDALAQVWRIDIGAGADSARRLGAMPLAAGGKLYVMDSHSTVAAFDAESGRELWRVGLRPRHEERGAHGGGIAYDRGRLFATTGYGDVFALNAETGKMFWKRGIGVPLRAAPTVDSGRVFVISYDNQMNALSDVDGEVLWSHAGIPEDAGLLGSASAAVEGDIVVAPYSSGELFAMRVENGRVLWSDQLVRAGGATALAALSDIRGRPVMDRGLVIAISHAGRMVAIDARTGERIWDLDIAGIETPWVAGEFIYVVTTSAEVVCVSRRDGRVRWVTQLQRFEDEEDKEDPILWTGPVLASDRLVLVSSHGFAVAISPYDGHLLGQMELPDGVALPPIVADGVLYLLTDDADLIALR